MDTDTDITVATGEAVGREADAPQITPATWSPFVWPAAPEMPARATSRLTRRRVVRTLCVAVAMAAVAAVAALTVNDVQTRQALTASQRDASTTQAQLTATQGDLRAARSARDKLQSEMAQLQASNGSLQSAIDRQNGELGDAQSQIDALSSCSAAWLASFEAAMLSDKVGFDHAMNAVQDTCPTQYQP